MGLCQKVPRDHEWHGCLWFLLIHKLDVAFMQSDWGLEMRPGRNSDNSNFKLEALAGSRHLYETVLRKLVLGLANIKIEADAAVAGLQFDALQKRVTGMFLSQHRPLIN